MKTTRIDIEGPLGSATIRRDGWRIVITGTRVTKVIERKSGEGVPVGEIFQLEADAGEPLGCKTIVEKKGDAARFAKADRGMFTLKA